MEFRCPPSARRNLSGSGTRYVCRDRRKRVRGAPTQALLEAFAGRNKRSPRAWVVPGEPGIFKARLLSTWPAGVWCRVARAAGVQYGMELVVRRGSIIHQAVRCRFAGSPWIPARPQAGCVGGHRRSCLRAGAGRQNRFLVGLAVLVLLSEVADETARWLCPLWTMCALARRGAVRDRPLNSWQNRPAVSLSLFRADFRLPPNVRGRTSPPRGFCAGAGGPKKGGEGLRNGDARELWPP